MALSKKMCAAINSQITAENESAYIYKAMGYKFEAMNLTVFAKWFHIQAAEEQAHAEKFARYILDRGSEVTLETIKAPKGKWKTPKEICSETLKHEEYITERINKLVDLAREERDHSTDSFLIWFVNEQIEEEASAAELLAMVELAGTLPQIFLLEDRLLRMIGEREQQPAE